MKDHNDDFNVIYWQVGTWASLGSYHCGNSFVTDC